VSDPTDYRNTWESVYRKAYSEGRKHWRPELATPPAFAEFMNSEWAPHKGARILEAGCGDGLNVIYLAGLGYDVTGVDVSEAAISRARQVAAENGVRAEFLCMDLVRQAVPCDGRYDLWVDIKTLHVLWEDRDRQSYLAHARAGLREKGLLFLNGGLALADVRDYFPSVFRALDPEIGQQADTLDRDLPREKRSGIRCETLDWYCSEVAEASFSILKAYREASEGTGWGAIVIAQKGRYEAG